MKTTSMLQVTELASLWKVSAKKNIRRCYLKDTFFFAFNECTKVLLYMSIFPRKFSRKVTPIEMKLDIFTEEGSTYWTAACRYCTKDAECPGIVFLQFGRSRHWEWADHLGRGSHSKWSQYTHGCLWAAWSTHAGHFCKEIIKIVCIWSIYILCVFFSVQPTCKRKCSY